MLVHFETLIIYRKHLLRTMSKFDLLNETLLGNLGETIPISLWKHHPNRDRNPEDLAEAEIAFHKMYDHDVLKISFHGRYPVVDWGCIVVYDGALTGSTTCTNCVVEQASDWETLEPLDVNAGEFGKQTRAVELISEYSHGRVPTMATIFDPPMVAAKLCSGTFTEYIDDYPDVMKSVLDMITNVMIDFGRAAIEAGADGLFLASQHSTELSVTDEQYKEFIYPYDQKLISKLRGKAKYMIMHLHARETDEVIRFKEIVETPGLDAVNWEDQSASPTLKEGKRLARKVVFGGIDHNGVFRTGDVDEAKKQVIDTISDAGYDKLVVAPGCVITVDTPEENIRAVVDAVRSINPFEDE